MPITTGDNTNSDSFFQKLLGSHKPPSAAQQKRMGKKGVAADRKLRAKQKMVDMSPEQKKAEIKRLKAKRAKK